MPGQPAAANEKGAEPGAARREHLLTSGCSRLWKPATNRLRSNRMGWQGPMTIQAATGPSTFAPRPAARAAEWGRPAFRWATVPGAVHPRSNASGQSRLAADVGEAQ